MARVTAQEYAEKHARRLKASLEDMRRGIQRVTEAPGAKAAAQADKMLANLTEAVTSGLWARRVGAVTLEEWRRKALDKGVNRVAAGIDAVQVSQVAMAERLLAAVDNAVAKVKTMPSTTFEDRIGRATQYMREMHGANIKQ